MRKLLITGETGFVGRNVVAAAEAIRRDFGWVCVVPDTPYDLRDEESLSALLARTQPDGVLHLAGVSFVPDSFNDPETTMQVNLLGSLHLLQALAQSNFTGSFLFVSSGDVYGRLGNQALPVTETHLLHPTNPYAVSKIAGEALCYQWSLKSKFRIVVARPFNHIGAGQREDFVLASMARQIVAIRRGDSPPIIEVGDIDVTRDFLDVRDVIYAYMHLLNKGESGEIYNVCSGHARKVRDLITALLDLAGVDALLQTNPARLRPVEQREMVACNRKLVATTGWQARWPLQDTLKNILDDWEQRTP